MPRNKESEEPSESEESRKDSSDPAALTAPWFAPILRLLTDYRIFQRAESLLQKVKSNIDYWLFQIIRNIAYDAWTGLSVRLGQSLEENELLICLRQGMNRRPSWPSSSVTWPSTISTRTSSKLTLVKSTSSWASIHLKSASPRCKTILWLFGWKNN